MANYTITEAVPFGSGLHLKAERAQKVSRACSTNEIQEPHPSAALRTSGAPAKDSGCYGSATRPARLARSARQASRKRSGSKLPHSTLVPSIRLRTRSVGAATSVRASGAPRWWKGKPPAGCRRYKSQRPPRRTPLHENRFGRYRFNERRGKEEREKSVAEGLCFGARKTGKAYRAGEIRRCPMDRTR